jgi:hypothetical protein
VILDDFILITEVEDVPDTGQRLFARKFNLTAPEFPHHIIALVNVGDGDPAVGCYTHFTNCGDMVLGGGACSDERILRRLAPNQREALRAAGGIYRYTLDWAIRLFAPRFPAMFAYCADALSARVMRQAGFVSTQHEHLFVVWMQDPSTRHREQMIAKAHSFGAF